MTDTNTALDTQDARELSATEIEEIAGGAINLGTWVRRVVWQMQNAPANSTLVGCSSDMSVCTWQSN